MVELSIEQSSSHKIYILLKNYFKIISKYLTFKLPLGLWTDSKIAVFISVTANYNVSLL